MTRRKVRNIVLVVLGVPCSILFILLAFADWAWGGRVQPSLDAQYVPTAEYLIQNTVAIPTFIDVRPPPGTTIESGETICVAVFVRRLSASEYDVAEWTHIYVNNQRISRSDYGVGTIGEVTPEGSVTNTVEFCFDPLLEKGLHVIEVQVASSVTALLNPAEARSYTWAYRVE